MMKKNHSQGRNRKLHSFPKSAILGVTLSLIFIFGCAEKAYVSAPSGLSVRNEPSIDGEKIGLLPVATEVEILDPNGPMETIGGIEAAWQKIRTPKVEGWVFSGWLVREDQKAMTIEIQECVNREGDWQWNGSTCEEECLGTKVGDLCWSGDLGRMTWLDATEQCKTLGMRLPTKLELRNVVNTLTGDKYFWTSESYEEDPNQAWTVELGGFTGPAYFDKTQADIAARCVR